MIVYVVSSGKLRVAIEAVRPMTAEDVAVAAIERGVAMGCPPLGQIMEITECSDHADAGDPLYVATEAMLEKAGRVHLARFWEKADDGLALTPCSGWVGKLTHDRSKHADWGWLRDESGELIVIVKMPFMEDEELHEHRRNGTDPAQGRVDAILAALYGQNV